MKAIGLLLILAFTITLYGCTEEKLIEQEELIEAQELDYFIFGWFYGLCVGEGCIEIYKIEDGVLYEDTNDQYPNGGGQTLGGYLELPNDKYVEVGNLVSSIPKLIWNQSHGTIGCPDCLDGGGVYVEISKEGIVKSWIIDSSLIDIPESFHEVVGTVLDAVVLLQ